MGGGGGAPSPPRYLQFTSADLQQLSPDAAQALAEQYNRQYYSESDADQASRNPALVDAIKQQQGQYGTTATNAAGQERVGNDLIAQGQQEIQNKNQIPPEILAAYTRAGLGDASSAMAGNLAPGSVGSFGVARNLGVNALQYSNTMENQGRAGIQAGLGAQGLANQTYGLANNSLGLSAELSPQRSFGLSGADAVGLTKANTDEANQVNQANVQGRNQYRASVYGAQAARSSQSSGGLGSILGGVGSIAGAAVGLLGLI